MINESNQKTIGYALIASGILLVVLLSAVKLQNDEQATMLCDVFSKQDWSMNNCPAHKNPISWYLLPAFAVAILIIAVGCYLAFIKQKQKTVEEVQSAPAFDASSLDGEELQVWNLLLESNGSLYQSDLLKKTSFSKVKLSRVLDKLESKGAVEKKRRGMANLVIAK